MSSREVVLLLRFLTLLTDFISVTTMCKTIDIGLLWRILFCCFFFIITDSKEYFHQKYCVTSMRVQRSFKEL